LRTKDAFYHSLFFFLVGLVNIWENSQQEEQL
jgi:hypothetical protein